MKFNTKVFWRVFLVLTIFESCLLLAGCTAAWLSAINGMLPSIAAVVNAIVAFVVALQGKTVSAEVAAAIKKWQGNVASEIANAQAIIAEIQKNSSAGLIAQFQAAMQAVLSEFNSILAGVAITDSATVAKLTQFVGLGIAAINAVLALIPMALHKLETDAPVSELKHYDKLAASSVKNADHVLKETYEAIIAQKTDNADVNAALDSLPHSI